jgi:hypothetical protein
MADDDVKKPDVGFQMAATINRKNEFEIPLLKGNLTMDEVVVIVVVFFAVPFMFILVIMAPMGMANYAMMVSLIPAAYGFKFMARVRKNQKEMNYLFDFFYKMGGRSGRGWMRCSGKLGKTKNRFGFIFEDQEIGMLPVDGGAPFLTRKQWGKPRAGVLMRRDTSWRRMMPPGAMAGTSWIGLRPLAYVLAERELQVDQRGLYTEMPTKRKGKRGDGSDVVKAPVEGFPAPAWFHPPRGAHEGALGYEQVIRPCLAFAFKRHADRPLIVTPGLLPEDQAKLDAAHAEVFAAERKQREDNPT